MVDGYEEEEKWKYGRNEESIYTHLRLGNSNWNIHSSSVSLSILFPSIARKVLYTSVTKLKILYLGYGFE